MTLRKHLRKISLLLEISDPQEIEDGIFQTKLTHPNLKGELSFVHSEFVGRDQVLKSLDENIVGHVLDLADVVGGIINGKGKNAAAPASPSGERPGSRSK